MKTSILPAGSCSLPDLAGQSSQASSVVGNIPEALTGVSTYRGVARDAVVNLYVGDQTVGASTELHPMLPLRPMRLSLPLVCQELTDWRSTVTATFGPANGSTGLGRIWKITGAGANCARPNLVNCTEVFRIQPMRNGLVLGGNISRRRRRSTGSGISLPERSPSQAARFL